MIDPTNTFLPKPIWMQRTVGVKVATPDILLDTDTLSIGTMEEYTFATIGGVELLSVSRHDLIDSPLNDQYTPVVDAGTKFKRQNHIVTTDVSKSLFSAYSINLSDHIVGDYANTIVSIVTEKDATTQEDVVNSCAILVKDIRDDYRVEVQFFPEFTDAKIRKV